MEASLGARPERGLVGGVLGVVLLCGCSGAIRDATQVGIQTGIDEAVVARNQRRLAEGLDPRALELGSRRIAAAAVDGTLEALADPARRERLAAALRGVEVPAALVRIDDGEVAEATHAAIAASSQHLDAVSLRALVHDVVDEAVRTSIAAARDELAVTDDGQALASLARELSKQATLGFQDAVEQASREHEPGTKDGAVLVAAGKAADNYGWLSTGALVGLGAVGAGLAALALTMHRRSRLLRRELELRDAALLRLTQAAAARSPA